MQKMKKIGTTIGILILVAALAAPVFAYRGGRGRGDGYGPGSCWSDGGRGDRLTDAQRTALNKLEENFLNKTSTLRTDVWAKSDELDAILRGSDPDVTKVKALQKEVSKLRTEMAEKRTDFILEAKKIAPEATFGRGPRGFGKSVRGCRGQRSGSGPGPCWE